LGGVSAGTATQEAGGGGGGREGGCKYLREKEVKTWGTAGGGKESTRKERMKSRGETGNVKRGAWSKEGIAEGGKDESAELEQGMLEPTFHRWEKKLSREHKSQATLKRGRKGSGNWGVGPLRAQYTWTEPYISAVRLTESTLPGRAEQSP